MDRFKDYLKDEDEKIIDIYIHLSTPNQNARTLHMINKGTVKNPKWFMKKWKCFPAKKYDGRFDNFLVEAWGSSFHNVHAWYQLVKTLKDWENE